MRQFTDIVLQDPAVDTVMSFTGGGSGGSTARMYGQLKPLSERKLSGFSWPYIRSEEHTSELQSHLNLVCRLLLEKKKISSYLFPHAWQYTPWPAGGSIAASGIRNAARLYSHRRAHPPPSLCQQYTPSCE